MDFDDFHERGHKQHNHGHHHGHDYSYKSSHSKHKQNEYKQMLLEKLQLNPKLKTFIIIALIIIIALVILLIVALFPLLANLFSYFAENGLQGIINDIWSGTKK